MKSKLDYIESRLEALIENRFTWLPWQSRQPRLARQIVDALRKGVFSEIEENQALPNAIQFYMHPDNLAAWQNNQDWLAWLTQAIQDSILEAGVLMTTPPIIHLVGDEGLLKDELRIEADFLEDLHASTAAMPSIGGFVQADQPESRFQAVLLLTDGTNFPLDQPVINIGRREDNHLVLDDLRVSRTHAQIRKIQGQHVLFDLNSTGGTFVNGKRISQYTLRSGDVISFAGVTAIFAHEASDSLEHTTTSPAQP